MGKTLIVSNIFKRVVHANKYENNDKITKVIITKSITDIETAAFKNCKNLNCNDYFDRQNS